ncbi:MULTISPECIES: hypothetical protein [Streptomyces]|nr:hypothetical protein [Streptomyces canarius]
MLRHRVRPPAFHERGGRDAGDDSYVMTGVAGGRAYTVTGDFAPHDGA